MKEAPLPIDQELLRQEWVARVPARPDTTIFTVVKYLVVYQLLAVMLALGLSQILLRTGVSFPFLWIYYASGAVVLVLVMKRLCILAIEVYQRYAPEEVRRRCVMIPSCSDYALQAIRNYGLIRGLYKAYARLFTKCSGNTVCVDYP
jgi:putative component of membrane protein insertase Oxa1/YidC/SpoIIIJ protein YidD